MWLLPLVIKKVCYFFSASVVSTLQVELFFPDIVIDEFGNKGFWTLIYNQVTQSKEEKSANISNKFV